MATSQLVDTDTLGDFTEVQPEKLRVRGNPSKGIISIRTNFFASRDAKFCVPEITGTTPGVGVGVSIGVGSGVSKMLKFLR